jgi:hypothetical protein
MYAAFMVFLTGLAEREARAESDKMEPLEVPSYRIRAHWWMRVARDMMGPPDYSWTHHVLVLLRQKFERLYFVIGVQQQGHRGKLATTASINRRRMVAIEFGM